MTKTIAPGPTGTRRTPGAQPPPPPRPAACAREKLSTSKHNLRSSRPPQNRVAVRLQQLPGRRPGLAMAAPLLLLLQLPGSTPAANIPRWSMIYDFDVTTNGSGTTTFTNVLWDANLTRLGIACAKFPNQSAMWSGVSTNTNGDSYGGCTPNVTQVFGEPYCGGPAGLYMGPQGNAWQIGADSWVAAIKDKPWVVGLWLGDEPEIAGVPYAQMCELALYLKTALIAAGRSDVFLTYNDGPGSGQLANGMCKGLDYFSMDSYADDPAQEVATAKRLFAPLLSKLRPPNPYEPRGQGVFLVPGLFWFMASCTDAGGAGSAGSDMAVCSDSMWCANGTQCDASPKWLVQKVQLYWEWALTEQGIHGFNTWHWADRPTMMPASFRRGAVSLGSELLQALQETGRNITKAHPDPRKLPPLFFCVHNQCVPSGNRSGVSEAACELDCGPQTRPQKLSPSVSKSDDDISWFASVRPPRGGRSAGVRGPQPPAASGQIVNVKSFGALGDGITPDDAAIQAAIDSAATRNDSTPAVYFPSGRYMLQRTLRVSPRGEEGTATRLIGDGPASQLIAGVALRGLSMLQYGLWDSPAPATMSEGEISGLGFNNTMGHAIHCINVSYVSYSSFANLVLLSAPTQSSHRVALLQMENVWGNTLVRGRFDCGGAICLQGTNGINHWIKKPS